MDYNQNYQNVQSFKKPAGNMANASFVLAITAISSTFLGTLILPFIFGGISILLAILSKGYEPKMTGSAKAAITCSIVALVINTLLFGGYTMYIFTNEDAFEQFDATYESMYGESFSDMYEDVTGRRFPIN